MEANQTIQITEDKLMLIRAIDFHMEHNNCCGRLIHGDYFARPGEIGQIFHCSYCYAEIEVSREIENEKEN